MLVKITNHTELWDPGIAWYSQCYLLAWSMALESAVLGLLDLSLIVKVFATWVKFLEPSGYCTVINCTFTFCTINVLKHLVTVLWSTACSPFAQQISWTIWLLYCDQLHVHLLHNKCVETSDYCTVINCIFTFCTINILNHLVTVLWSTAHSPFAQQISWTIWLLYCDQLHVHLLHNKCVETSGYCTVINCMFTFCTTNLLNHLVTVLWSTACSPFAQQIS